MKTVALTTALILSAVAPSFAGSAADIHALIAAEDESRNNGDVFVTGAPVALSSKGTSVAGAIFAQLAEEDDSNNNGLEVNVASKGSDRAAAIHAQLWAEDESNNNFR